VIAGNKFIVSVALNGGMQQDRDGAVIPKQPHELGEAAARCWEAGAAMVHVHARGPDGKNSGDKAIYAEIIRQIRARSPVLIQTTNGIGVRRDPATGQFIWPSDAERLGLLEIEPQQDLFGIAGGSADFYHPEGGYVNETPYVNSPDLLKQTIKAVYAMGSALEYEIVEASSIHRLMRYAEEGVFDRNRDNIWLLHGGGYGAVPAIARKVAERAKAKGLSTVAFAIAWVMRNKFVTAPIVGPRTEEQWDAYVPAIKATLDADDEAFIDSLVPPGHASTPGYTDPAYPIEGRQVR
jgi:3-keto-5-aminohexanoate cleavage enzyme